MPRKKPTEKKDMPVVAPETKFVRLELPIETHRRLRMQAAKEEMSMAQLAKVAVEEYLQRKAAAR